MVTRWGFVRSVFIISLYGLVTGLLELLHQGMPVLLVDLEAKLIYLLQILSFYAASGAAIGLFSSFVMLVFFYVVKSRGLVRLLRDLVPVAVCLGVYFTMAGGVYPKIPLGINPTPAGIISSRVVIIGVIVFSVVIILFGMLSNAGVRSEKGRARDLARAFAVVLVLGALLVGLSNVAKRPIEGNEDVSWENTGVDRPILVFGIDGSSWDVMMPIIESGRMPNLEKLMKRGTYGNFRTIGGALSSAIWTDMATGKKRSKHGITGNVQVEEGGYDALPPRSYDRKVPAIWNILSDAGKKVAVANWRVTYPPEQVNGIMASMLVFEQPQKVYPPALEEQIVDIARPWKEKRAAQERIFGSSKRGPQVIARNLLGDLEIERSVFTYLPTIDKFDFYACYSHATDAVQHLFWKYRDPDRFHGSFWDLTEPEWDLTEENIESFQNLIDEFHIKADSILGETIESMGGDPSVIVISDHGQHAARRPNIFVDSYRLLELLDLLKFDPDGAIDFSTCTVYPLTPLTMTNRAAFSLNLEGREKDGWIKKGPESERILRDVVKKFSSIRDVESGKPFFKKITLVGSENVGRNFDSDRVDLLVQPDVSVYDKDARIEIEGSEYVIEEITEVRGISGKHTNLGIFVFSTPQFRQGVLIPASNTMTASVLRLKVGQSRQLLNGYLERACRFFNLREEVTTLDLTPTLLSLFDLPIAKDMDGKLHPNLLKDEFLQSRNKKWVESYDHLQVIREELDESTLSEEEMESLRALGYIK